MVSAAIPILKCGKSGFRKYVQAMKMFLLHSFFHLFSSRISVKFIRVNLVRGLPVQYISLNQGYSVHPRADTINIGYILELLLDMGKF
jgi:hypothetical protein